MSLPTHSAESGVVFWVGARAGSAPHLGAPLQLKLTVRGGFEPGGKKEILALPPTGPGSLLDLWVQPAGRLFLGGFAR